MIPHDKEDRAIALFFNEEAG